MVNGATQQVPVPREQWRREMRALGETKLPPASGSRTGARSKSDAKGDDGDGGEGHRFAKEQLKAFVERIERLQEERKAISDDIADVYAEAKGNGYDRKALAYVIRLRGQDVNERKEHEAIVETYMHALGMF